MSDVRDRDHQKISHEASRRELSNERDRLKLLLDINNAIVSHLDLTELLKVISTNLRKVVPHDISGIGLYDEASGQLRARVLGTPGKMSTYSEGAIIPMEESTGGRAFTSGKPVFVSTFPRELVDSEHARRIYDSGARSGGSIPLIAHGRKLGVLGIASFDEYGFTEQDIELLCQVANQIAIAVENSLNYGSARDAERESARRLDQLHLLLDVSNNVTSHLDLHDLFDAISVCLRRVISCDGIALALVDRDSGVLRLHSLGQDSIISIVREGAVLPIEGSPAERVLKTLKPLKIDRAMLEKFDNPIARHLFEKGVHTGCLAPLVSHGKVLGTLSVVSVKEDAFSDEDIHLLTQIAAQIAIAVENALNFERGREAEQQAAREREKLELVRDINNRIASSLDLKELFTAISGCLRNLLHQDYADLAIYDANTDQIRQVAIDRDASIHFGKEEIWSPVEGSPVGLAIHSRQTVRREHTNLAEFPSEGYRRATEEGLLSGCTVPLISRDRVVGVLTVASLRESAFSEADAALLTEIGVQVAIAVDNSLNYEAVRTAEAQLAIDRDRLNLLLNVNNAIVSHLDLRELLRKISEYLRQTLRYDLVGISLYDPEGDQLRAYMYEFGDKRPFIGEGQAIPLAGSIGGLVYTTGKPFFSSIPQGQFSSAFNRSVTEAGLKSGGCVPLFAHGRKLGVLGIASFMERVYSDDEIDLLNQIAGQIALALENALAYREIEALKNKLNDERLYLEEEIKTTFQFEQIIGSSPALKRILKQVETVAPTDSTVLIQGETGTGKEVIARAIHSLSVRKERTVVKLNCAAIPTGLLESELFGHEKGAFTGAIAQRIGRFELANKGTLFLDEVGEIPQDLQPKLLRVLQEREFERLGSPRTLKVDVRLIAATNRDLKQMVSERQFRDDLYYRLNVFPITIPSLRERQEDIPLLVRFFASKFARSMKKQIETIPSNAVAALQQYHWPGNIRELENVIERAVILSPGKELQIPLHELTPRTATAVAVGQAAAPSEKPPQLTSLEEVEREHILRVLRETDWVVSGPNGAAATLGLKRTTLQARMKKLGISRTRAD